MTRILIADDQRDVLEALRILLKGEGYQTEAVTSIAGLFNALQKKDFALLMMEAVRSLGLAARFVSGYLYVPSRDGPEYLGGGSTHAWCQVYLPGAGWVEFDPTNGIIGNRDLIRVAVARAPGQAVPLSGTYLGNVEDELDMRVEVNVKCETDAEISTGPLNFSLPVARSRACKR